MSVSRRHFLATTASVAAATSLLSSRRTFAAESADIRIATIGVRGRGQSHLDGLSRNIVAICDVDEDILGRSGYKDSQGSYSAFIADHFRIFQR